MIRWRRSGPDKQAKWSASNDERQRHAHARRAAHSRRHPAGAHDVRRERPRHEIPADRSAASARGRAERSRRTDRRRGIRRVERVRRAVPDAERSRSSRPRGSSTIVFTRPRSARRRAPRCSPGATITRSAWARITEMATSAPGQNSIRPNTCAPLAEMLKLNGYSTAQFGKCHEVPVWETSPVGPFEHWPSGGGGFEYFYGFIGGETNQYYPAIFEGTTPVEPKKTPEEGYHFTDRHDGQGDQVDPPAEVAHCPTSRSSSTSRRARRTRRITFRRNGPTSTRASSIRAGTSCARRPSRGRRSSASSPRIASSRSVRRRSRRGTRSRPR